jgi:GrpB-like predicted nucleotidyltransferase (UPF0157 family)
MQLVGALKFGGADWDLDECEAAFRRLSSEVRHVPALTRFVGYACEQEGIRFLGIEVERIDSIPIGMIALELRADSWSVHEPGCEPPWQGSLDWLWLDKPASARPIGEFCAKCPSDWSGASCSEHRVFGLTFHSYTALGERNCQDEVHLMDYDPSWPAMYQEFADWLRAKLGADVALRTEHYGSTAIPGMPAKPIIDVLVEVPSFAEARRRAIPAFNTPEIEYCWFSAHCCFIVRSHFLGERTHHIHMITPDHQMWQDIAFRDYLRLHPETAARYATLKAELAVKYRGDRERYTMAKTDFIREITAVALKESVG